MSTATTRLSTLLSHIEPAVKPKEQTVASFTVSVVPAETKPDGVTDFQKGQRDFSADDSSVPTQIKYDFEASTKEYTNGVVAANRTREIRGALSGDLIQIPDVNSGYPVTYRGGTGSNQWFDRGDGMPDFLENRMKFGVIIPSTNTTVEHDYWRMLFDAGIQGVGFHSTSILIKSPKLANDNDMLEFLAQFRREIFRTIDRSMTAEPEYIIMGMSLETFFGGWEGNKELKGEIKGRCGLSVGTGAEACKYALEAFKAKNIAIITPYQDIGDRNVVKFFEEIGMSVKRIHGLKCGSATDIAHVDEAWCEEVIKNTLYGPDIDAIVQCGTNLSMIKVSDKLEKELNIPIIAINAATLWFSLREVGITTKIPNATRLLREF